MILILYLSIVYLSVPYSFNNIFFLIFLSSRRKWLQIGRKPTQNKVDKTPEKLLVKKSSEKNFKVSVFEQYFIIFTRICKMQFFKYPTLLA